MSKPDTSAFFVYEDDITIKNEYVDGSECAEGVKVSNRHNVTLTHFTVIGGYEDCVDMVRGNNYSLIKSNLICSSKTRTFITAKGGIDGLLLKDLVLNGKPRWWWDISLGDHTIYNDQGDMTLMKNVVIDNIIKGNGKRVWILCLWCDKPALLEGKYFLIKPPKFLVRFWFWIKRKIA